MSSGGSSPVTTQTQTKDPWSGAAPYLSDMFLRAQTMSTTNTGYQPYAGPTQADLNAILQSGLTSQQAMAQSQIFGSPDIIAAQGLAGNVMANQGLTPAGQQAIAGLGGIAANTGTVDPYLQSTIESQQQNIRDQINAQMSGAGRYGSGAYDYAMSRGLAEVADPVLAQDYARRQQLAAQSYGQLGQIGQGALAQAGQFAQLAPGLQQAQYMPGQMVSDIGQFYQGRAQQDLQGQIALYNAQQAYPWQQLEREAAILAGAGQLGGQQVTASTTQVPLTQRLLGGGLAGAGLGGAIGGLPGAGLGALGGGLLGFL